MRRFVLALALFASACNANVTGELRLSTPVPTDSAVARATLWEYDPFVADASADPIATFEIALQRGVQAVPFSLDPEDSDSGLSHYVTANVDLDDDGVDEVGDYVVTDFHKVELGTDRVIIPLTPRMP